LRKASKSVIELMEYDRDITPPDCKIIAGIDEAGRGPLAGPVLAAAVIMPKTIQIEGVYDSKALTPLQRERVFSQIISLAIDIGIGVVESDIIDKINILQATILAMNSAIEDLHVRPDCILIDAVTLPYIYGIVQRPIKKGDQKSYSIAAASIIAKVVRDRLMSRLHKKYPIYNFAKNKGYGTREHREALSKLGPSPVHRLTFKRVKEFCRP